MSQLPPPTPAAVRGVIKPADKCTDAELDAFRTDPRKSTSLLIDHIHAVAAELRFHAVQAAAARSAISGTASEVLLCYANDLRAFADKMEGIEP